MHHLHPRSRSTSTLFTTTLAISFLVVGAPHLLPCPVDRRQFADSFEAPDGKRYRRKRREVSEPEPVIQEHLETATGASGGETVQDGRPKRECPVPKPGGLVGQLMGFKNEERPRPAELIVQPLDAKNTRRMPKRGEDEP